MKESDAADQVAILRAAFSRDRMPDATGLLYTSELARLDSPEALADAVRSLVRSEDRLPSIAAIREEYGRYADRYAPRGLPEPPPTSADRALAIKRARELADRIGRSIDEEPS